MSFDQTENSVTKGHWEFSPAPFGCQVLTSPGVRTGHTAASPEVNTYLELRCLRFLGGLCGFGKGRAELLEFSVKVCHLGKNKSGQVRTGTLSPLGAQLQCSPC